MPQRMNESIATENLQRYLRQLSYHEASISPPPIDGIFDSDTQKSLTEFQRLYNLPITGIADIATWEALYSAYRASLTRNTPPRQISLFPFVPQSGEAPSLSQGSEAFAVIVLQHMLRELSTLYTELASVELSGKYDEATENAVKAFQRKNRLPVSGETDVPTWNTVADQYNLLFLSDPFL